MISGIPLGNLYSKDGFGATGRFLHTGDAPLCESQSCSSDGI